MQAGTYKHFDSTPIRALLLSFLFICALLFLPAPAFSESVLVIADTNSKSQKNFINALQKSHLEQTDALTVKPVKYISSNLFVSEKFKLLITVGTKNALAVSKINNIELPVLNTLIPASAFKKIPVVNSHVSAIFIDQPVSRRLELIRLALPHAKRIGLITTSETAYIAEEIKSQLHIDEKLIHHILKPEENLLRQLSRLLNKSDILFSINDPKIYNRSTAKGILLTSYRNSVPVLGFSSSYVRAGALLSIQSSPQQIAQQTAEWINDFFRADLKIPANSLAPEYFSVSINSRVARSMNLNLESESVLYKHLNTSGDHVHD